MPITPEDRIQITFKDWADKQDFIATHWHVANERPSSAKQGAYLKRKGVLSGVWDYWVILKNSVLAAIEFKAGNNKLSENQVKFEKALSIAKIPHKVCYSAYEAAEFVRELAKVKGE